MNMIYANIYAEGHLNNSLFADNDPTNFYGPTYIFRLLRDLFYRHGVELNTADLNFCRNISFEIYSEGQKISHKPFPKFFLAQENPTINNLNQDIYYCQQFAKVFAWDRRVANQENGIFLMIPHEIKLFEFNCYSDRQIFTCLINGNKRFPKYSEDDLYEERFAVIEWYQQNAALDFSLYGRGWDKPKAGFTRKDKLIRRGKRLATQLFGYKPFPSYRGSVINKGDIYKNCKFSYCYENTKNLENYITEKIFDAMMYGCVPIYWGAQNILDFIPKECFIDRRDFDNQKSLHEYLKNMSVEVYESYQRAIYDFLRSDKILPFKAETYANRVVDEIIHDLKFKKIL
jgi:hypothetical protein